MIQKLFPLLVMMFLLTSNRCTKNESTKKNLLPGRCRISCNISGAVSGNYTSDDNYSFSAYNAAAMALEAVLINNTTSIRQDISFLFPLSITTGNYNLDEAGAPNITMQYLKKNIYIYDDKIWKAGIGSDFNVQITKVSYNEIEGTFSGTATNSSDSSTVQLTNGKFYTQFSH